MLWRCGGRQGGPYASRAKRVQARARTSDAQGARGRVAGTMRGPKWKGGGRGYVYGWSPACGCPTGRALQHALPSLRWCTVRVRQSTLVKRSRSSQDAVALTLEIELALRDRRKEEVTLALACCKGRQVTLAVARKGRQGQRGAAQARRNTAQRQGSEAHSAESNAQCWRRASQGDFRHFWVGWADAQLARACVSP